MNIKPVSFSFLLVALLSRAGFASEHVDFQPRFDAGTAKAVLKALIDSHSKNENSFMILNDVISGRLSSEELSQSELDQLDKDLDIMSFHMSAEKGSII